MCLRRHVLAGLPVQVLESFDVDTEVDPVKIYHNWKKEMDVAHRLTQLFMRSL